MATVKKILLDTNIAIKAFDDLKPSQKDDPEIKLLRQKVRNWLLAPDVELSITPLIRFEVLNKPGLSKERLLKLNAAMDQLNTRDINNEVATLAATLLHQVMDEKRRRLAENKETYSDEQERITALKYRFDVFHVAAEKVHGLELVSHDDDIKLIQHLHDKFALEA